MSGKDNFTMPITPEYADGYERTFGDRKPVRGKWIWSDAEQKLVSVEDYQPPELARDAPIMVDRFYENTSLTVADDKGRPVKIDIGSRQKHRAYLKENGATTIDDYTETWKRAEKERRDGSDADRRARREAIGRAEYEVEKRDRNARRR